MPRERHLAHPGPDAAAAVADLRHPGSDTPVACGNTGY